jgi:hypothetical protein
VEFISSGRSTAYIIQRDVQQQYFRITAPEKSYLIRAELSDGSHAQYPVDGFDDSPVVFRASEDEAVRIPNHRLLKPGGHIVVGRKPIANFHASLMAKSLRTLVGLHAVLIEIPEDPNWQVRQNVKSILGFQITSGLARYAFFSPAGTYEVGPDCWEIARDSEVIIFIRLADNGPTFARLLVQHRVSGHLTTDYLPLGPTKREFVIRCKVGSWRPDVLRQES